MAVRSYRAVPISAAIRRCAFSYAQETDLHLGIEAVLKDVGYSPLSEVRITGGRIDFIVDQVGIEVKVKGTRDALHRQLLRYAESPRIAELLVVTTVRAHRGLPESVGGKPLSVLVVGGVS